MPMTWYEHKQTGWKTIFVLSFILGSAAILILIFRGPEAVEKAGRAQWGLLSIFLLLMLANRMEIRVTERELAIRWGWLIQRRIPLSEIERIEMTRIGWTEVGMKRRHDTDWLSVSPGPALKFFIRDDDPLVLGTPDPEGLLRALGPLVESAKREIVP